MARIYPFRALRYNTAKAGTLENLVTQPYDKITPAMLERYHSLSPYNLSRIIKTTDYAGAAERLSQWKRDAILVPEQTPAVYAYSQTFRVPGSNETRIRRGFIAAGGLEPYEAGVVFRHEQTLTGPKQDRLALLRATRTHFGQLFMLYSDASGEVDQVLDGEWDKEPIESATDEYGVQHRVWRISEARTLAELRKRMSDKKLIIADGHHRYETALAFRDECRMAAGQRAASVQPLLDGADCVPAYEAVMMTFVNMEQPGLTILPTHRLLSQFPGFDRARFLGAAAKFFVAEPTPVERGRAALAASPAGHAIGVAFHEADGAEPDFVLLTLKPGLRMEELMPSKMAAERGLDVLVLHQVLLKQCLGIDEEAVREEKFLQYVREFEKGLDAVRSGAPACFFLNPVRIEQMRDIAFAGGVMPQKSTDFYPKMLSGLTGFEV